ncbi:MAG: glutathione S-transferase [Cypionkella sp.]|nr:glutathione S-transferase [Cypionkella sp.]
MKLYTSPTTPFGRKITVLLHEGGLLGQIEIVPVSGTALDVGSLPLAHNPLGKIPVLLLDDGTAIYDSRVISRYLDDHFSLNLYPKGPELWPFLAREAAIDGMIDAAVLMAYEMRLRPEEARFAAWVEGQWAKVTRALDMFEKSPLGAKTTMLHLSLACALGYLDFRHGPRHWRHGRPQLALWYNDFAQRDSLMATMPVS